MLDTKVIAYRIPEGEGRMADLHPKVTSTGENLDAAALMDGDLSKPVALPVPQEGKQAWIQFEFAQPLHTQAFTIAAGSAGMFGGAAIPDGEAQARPGWR